MIKLQQLFLFSFETYKIILKASELSTTNYIEPFDLILAIFNTKNLVTAVLNIPNLPYITQIKLIKQLSYKSILLLSELLYHNKIINTLDILQYCLIKYNYITQLLLTNFNTKNINFIKNIYLYYPTVIIKSLNYNKFIKFNNIIIGRNIEITNIINILHNKLNRNPLLIGDIGIGKFSIIKGTYFKSKLQLYNKEFYLLNYNKIFIQNNIDKFKVYITNWLYKNSNNIIIFNNIEEYLLEDREEYTIIFTLLKYFINKLKVQLILTISNKKYIEKILSKLYIKNILNTLHITEPTTIEVLKILRLKSLILYPNLKISLNSLKQIIKLSDLYIKSKVFPLKALEILDISNSLLKNNSNLNTTTIEKAISLKTGIPCKILSKDIHKKLNIKNLEIILKQQIFGQDDVIHKISSSLRRALLGIKSPNKPIGSWLLCGPSGTGKTELSKTLAKILFGNKTDLIRFDMSEFMEKHSISKLIGSPPGYIGFGERGQLTEAVEKRPYSVILFDEIEKADPTISNIMLQILDEGQLRDSTGIITKFSNTIILYTSNLGCPTELEGFNIIKNKHNIIYSIKKNVIYKSIRTYFRPEFINRLDNIFIFQPLNESTLLLIVEKFIKQFILQFKELNIPIIINIEYNIKIFLTKLSNSPIYGARPLKRLIDELISEPIIEILLKLNLKNLHKFIYSIHNNNIVYTILPILK